MAANNRPRGRERNITGNMGSVSRRGSGLGTGPVGSGRSGPKRPSSTPSGRDSRPSASGGYTRSGQNRAGASSDLFSALGTAASVAGAVSGGRRRRKRGGLLSIIFLLAAIFLILRFLGSCNSKPVNFGSAGLFGSGSGYSGSGYGYGGYGSLYGGSSTGGYSGYYGGSGSSSSGWTLTPNTGELDISVAKGARSKFTKLLGNNSDTVTVMVYLCGTDLESRSGMATKDLMEMQKAVQGSMNTDNVNLIIYTGGCNSWKNNIVSSSKNQIFKLDKGGFMPLVSDAGSSSMVKSDTLAYFIEYCADKYPANRNILVLWDHGGGSVSGFGYDERYSPSSSMSLSGIDTALSKGGLKFDIIGFDACLMATAENAFMLARHGDYMLASEETEPGIGWDYTGWLSALMENSSISSLELGKIVIDDFVDACASQCPGQKTTLSLVDLAELQNTMPDRLDAFAASVTELINSDGYATVSSARTGAREYATSSKIDQIDLVSFASLLGTQEGKALSEAMLGAVKYNRCSPNITDCYGISIYFPYRRSSYVASAVSNYSAIGLGDEYSRCIQAFAGMSTGGQAASGSSSLFDSLFGYSDYTSGASSGSSDYYSGYSNYQDFLSDFYSGSGGSGSYYGSSADIIGSLLQGLLGGGSSSGGYIDRSLNLDNASAYIAANSFDASALVWQQASDGGNVMVLGEKQWSLVNDLNLSVYYDDGEGYIDLGTDNVFDFTEDGALIGEFGGTWLSINGQIVAYYHTDTYDDGVNYTITGYVPCYFNGARAKLILVFNNDKPYGYVAGVEYHYNQGETDTIPKALLGVGGEDELACLKPGDIIDFVCDYYRYDGSYEDSYYLGDTLTFTGELSIGDTRIDTPEAVLTCYVFTDIFGGDHYSAVLPQIR